MSKRAFLVSYYVEIVYQDLGQYRPKEVLCLHGAKIRNLCVTGGAANRNYPLVHYPLVRFSNGRRNHKKTSLYRTHSEAKNFIL